MKLFRTILPAILCGMTLASVANAQEGFGTVQTGGAFGVGGGSTVATAPAPAGTTTLGPASGLGGLGGAGAVALGVGAIIAIGGISGGNNSSSGTN